MAQCLCRDIISLQQGVITAHCGQKEAVGTRLLFAHSFFNAYDNFVFQQQCPPTDLSFNFDANKQQRQLIAELENKNRYCRVCLLKIIYSETNQDFMLV